MAICFCWFFALTCANSQDRKNQSGPYRPYSAELYPNNNDEFLGMDEADFAKLSLEDVLLKRAYHSIFNTAVGGNFITIPPQLNGALSDMRRRGNGITPMLIKLMNENHETGFEMNVLNIIPNVGNLDLEPYLNYARDTLRERTQTMNAGVAQVSAILLARKGTKEDAELLRWVIEERPYVAEVVIPELNTLNNRLGLPTQKTQPSLNDKPNTSEPQSSSPPRIEQKPSTAVATKKLESGGWIVWTLVILGLGSLLRVVLRKRK
jgi:hypothetical protein